MDKPRRRGTAGVSESRCPGRPVHFMDTYSPVPPPTKFTVTVTKLANCLISLPHADRESECYNTLRHSEEGSTMLIKDLAVERRKKARFPMNRDVRYKVLEGDTIVEFGMGTTLDMGSGGVAF